MRGIRFSILDEYFLLSEMWLHINSRYRVHNKIQILFNARNNSHYLVEKYNFTEIGLVHFCTILNSECINFWFKLREGILMPLTPA